MPRGGAREGAGRKQGGQEARTKRFTINLTSKELEEVRAALDATGIKNRANALLKIIKKDLD